MQNISSFTNLIHHLALTLSNEVLNTLDTLLPKHFWQKNYSNAKAREKVTINVICQS